MYDDVEVVNYRKTFVPGAVDQDVAERSIRAHNRYPTFFNSPEHIKRVARVHAIVDEFFKTRRAVYENDREGRHGPFTVIKVERPVFPNHLPKAERDRLFHDPLRELGVEVKFSTGTNSWLFHVK